MDTEHGETAEERTGTDRDGQPPRSNPPTRQDRILSELAAEGEAEVSFQGLRRRLGIHQQSLTRALERLEDEGLVDSGRRGYRLTDPGYDALGPHAAPRAEGAAAPVAHALLPPDLSEDRVARALEQRWFETLRWYGIVEAPGETTLVWLTEPDQRFVRLRLHGGAFTLEIAGEIEPEPPAFGAVGPLLAAVGELYGLSGGATAVQALAADERPFAA